MVGIYLSFRVDKALYRERAGISGDLLGTSGGGALWGCFGKKPPHRVSQLPEASPGEQTGLLAPLNRGLKGVSKPNRGPEAGHGEFSTA